MYTTLQSNSYPRRSAVALGGQLANNRGVKAERRGSKYSSLLEDRNTW
jgi:hypothetical protein